MKRSSNINIFRMKKSRSTFLLRPLYLGVVASLAACGSNTQEAKVIKNPEQCVEETTLTIQECEVAYKKALEESERVAPKYSNQRECEAEFGYRNCGQQTSSGFFMPLMTGFLLSELLNSGRRHYNPVYTYRGSRSNYRDRIMTSNGSILSRNGRGTFHVSKDTLTKKAPTVKKTISRGGFGSKASAKSSWGGGGSSRGWGG